MWNGPEQRQGSRARAEGKMNFDVGRHVSGGERSKWYNKASVRQGKNRTVLMALSSFRY
jgi:hypothetical protein